MPRSTPSTNNQGDNNSGSIQIEQEYEDQDYGHIEIDDEQTEQDKNEHNESVEVIIPNTEQQIEQQEEQPNKNEQCNYYNAKDYGLSPTNTGEENSAILQELINSIPPEKIIYIPSGEYKFAEIGQQTIGSHCIKMRSNINIIGDGETTVLKPVGKSSYGLDMFYFNELLDSKSATYLENCTFKNFVIDSIDTYPEKYTSAGKGFMLNLYKNCHWENVIVKNTDGTGFGMDCPIDCTITNCTAINCGKSATTSNTGASGFGIGFGYNDNENIEIKNCVSIGNKKFGFFFEHQGVFNPKLYQAKDTNGFSVIGCEADGNYYNFGGIAAEDVVYDYCTSKNHIADSFYFESSEDCKVINCIEE